MNKKVPFSYITHFCFVYLVSSVIWEERQTDRRSESGKFQTKQFTSYCIGLIHEEIARLITSNSCNSLLRCWVAILENRRNGVVIFFRSHPNYVFIYAKNTLSYAVIPFGSILYVKFEDYCISVNKNHLVHIITISIHHTQLWTARLLHNRKYVAYMLVNTRNDLRVHNLI